MPALPCRFDGYRPVDSSRSRPNSTWSCHLLSIGRPWLSCSPMRMVSPSIQVAVEPVISRLDSSPSSRDVEARNSRYRTGDSAPHAGSDEPRSTPPHGGQIENPGAFPYLSDTSAALVPSLCPMKSGELPDLGSLVLVSVAGKLACNSVGLGKPSYRPIGEIPPSRGNNAGNRPPCRPPGCCNYARLRDTAAPS